MHPREISAGDETRTRTRNPRPGKSTTRCAVSADSVLRAGFSATAGQTYVRPIGPDWMRGAGGETRSGDTPRFQTRATGGAPPNGSGALLGGLGPGCCHRCCHSPAARPIRRASAAVSLVEVARSEGFEPPTLGSEGWGSWPSPNRETVPARFIFRSLARRLASSTRGRRATRRATGARRRAHVSRRARCHRGSRPSLRPPGAASAATRGCTCRA